MLKISSFTRFPTLRPRRPAQSAGQHLPRVPLLAAVAAVVLALSPPAAAGVVLAPHSALYAIKLLSARDGSNVNTVSGEMGIKWDAGCSGWAMNHRMLLDVSYVDGNVVRITMDASTWESRAGDRYTFSVHTRFNDRTVDRIEGHAVHLPGRNEAVFTAPEAKVFALPDDVLFPTAHTEVVIAAARDHRKILPARVFDGFSVGSAMLVNTVIGRKIPPLGTKEKTFPGLAGQSAWNMQLAFFSAASADAEPESEIGTMLYENGVARRLDMGFDDFKVRADLVKLNLSAPPVCGSTD